MEELGEEAFEGVVEGEDDTGFGPLGGGRVDAGVEVGEVDCAKTVAAEEVGTAGYLDTYSLLRGRGCDFPLTTSLSEQSGAESGEECRQMKARLDVTWVPAAGSAKQLQ